MSLSRDVISLYSTDGDDRRLLEAMTTVNSGMVVYLTLHGFNVDVGDILTASILDHVFNVHVVSVDGDSCRVEPCTSLTLLSLATSRDT